MRRPEIFALSAALIAGLTLLVLVIVGLVGSKDSSLAGASADAALADSLTSAGMQKAGELYWKWPDQQHQCSSGQGCYFLTVESAGVVCPKGISVRLMTQDKSKDGPQVPLDWYDKTPLTVAQPRTIEIPARADPPNQAGGVFQLICNR